MLLQLVGLTLDPTTNLTNHILVSDILSSSKNTNNEGTRTDTVSMDDTKANMSLTEIVGVLQTLWAKVATLQVQNAALQAQTVPSSVPTSTPCKPSPPSLSFPCLTNGNHDKHHGFLNQCWLLFLLFLQSYSSDQARVGLIISLLTREALALGISTPGKIKTHSGTIQGLCSSYDDDL